METGMGMGMETGMGMGMETGMETGMGRNGQYRQTLKNLSILTVYVIPHSHPIILTGPHFMRNEPNQ